MVYYVKIQNPNYDRLANDCTPVIGIAAEVFRVLHEAYVVEVQSPNRMQWTGWRSLQDGGIPSADLKVDRALLL